MGSMFAKLRQEATIGSASTKRIVDFDDTDPYYFVVKENGKVLVEGDLMRVKLKLDDSYLYRKIKWFTRDQTIMVATIDF